MVVLGGVLWFPETTQVYQVRSLKLHAACIHCAYFVTNAGILYCTNAVYEAAEAYSVSTGSACGTISFRLAEDQTSRSHKGQSFKKFLGGHVTKSPRKQGPWPYSS